MPISMVHMELKRRIVCHQLGPGRITRCSDNLVTRLTATRPSLGLRPTRPRWPTTLRVVSPANPRHLSRQLAARRLRLRCRSSGLLFLMTALTSPSKSTPVSSLGGLILRRRRLSVVSILRVIDNSSRTDCLVDFCLPRWRRLRYPCNIGRLQCSAVTPLISLLHLFVF